MQLVAETRPPVKRDRLIRIADVESATGLKKSNLYVLMRRGEFPISIRVSPRCVAWSEAAVLSWIQGRIAAAQQPTAAGDQ